MQQVPSVSFVPLKEIDANPWRRLEDFPYDKAKLTALQHSMKDVGMWPGIIGRRAGNRVQLAFGHHRKEAARLIGLTKLPVILMPLTDKQMVEYLGRENLEDYNADFLTMLETWVAAETFLTPHGELTPQPLEIAKLLGWTRPAPRSPNNHAFVKVAEACYTAHALIRDEHMTRDQLQGLTVRAAFELVTSIASHHRSLEAMGKHTKRPAAEIEGAKKTVSKAGAVVATQVQKEEVATTQISGTLDLTVYAHAKQAKQQTPLVHVFIERLAQRVAKLLATDDLEEKLTALQPDLPGLNEPQELAAIDRLALEFRHLGHRVAKWEKVFSSPKERVVPLRGIEGGRNG